MTAPQRIDAILVGRAVVPRGAGRAQVRAIAHAALSDLVTALGQDAGPISRRCPSCGSDAHGRPVMAHAPVVLSTASTRGLVVAAAALRDEVAALGVDVEEGPAAALRAELAPLFTPATAPTVGEWTAMEAALKADGRGFLLPPNAVVVAADTATVDGGPAMRLAELELPAGFAGSIAWRPARVVSDASGGRAERRPA